MFLVRYCSCIIGRQSLIDLLLHHCLKTHYLRLGDAERDLRLRGGDGERLLLSAESFLDFSPKNNNESSKTITTFQYMGITIYVCGIKETNSPSRCKPTHQNHKNIGIILGCSLPKPNIWSQITYRILSNRTGLPIELPQLYLDVIEGIAVKPFYTMRTGPFLAEIRPFLCFIVLSSNTERIWHPF